MGIDKVRDGVFCRIYNVLFDGEKHFVAAKIADAFFIKGNLGEVT
jgi:hypothetical protein